MPAQGGSRTRYRTRDHHWASLLQLWATPHLSLLGKNTDGEFFEKKKKTLKKIFYPYMYQWGKHTYFPKLSEIHINRLKKLVDGFLNLVLS